MEIKTQDSSSSSSSSTPQPPKGESSKIMTILNKIKNSNNNSKMKINKEIKKMVAYNKFINIAYIDKSKFGYSRTPLIYAILKKNYELSKFLILYNKVNTSLILQFILHIKYHRKLNDTQLIFYSRNCIIKSDINHQDTNGNTALLYACKLNNKKLAELLLKNGANPNLVNNKNKSPLMYTCKYGNKNFVEMLLNHHAKIDIESNTSGKTAFQYACGSGKLPIIKTLIQYKAINNKANYTDAFNYIPQNEHFDDVYDVLQSYTDICLNDYKYSLTQEEEKDRKNHLLMVYYKNSIELIGQCIEGNLENVKTLLKNLDEENEKKSNLDNDNNSTSHKNDHIYIDINFKDKHGYTALMWASYLGYTEIVNEFVHHENININAKCDIEKSAILLACEKEHIEIVKILLEHGANVNDTNYHDDTLLMIACLKGNNELTKLLLEYKANVNSQNKSNDTALIYAVERNQEECVKLLLNYKADLTLKNDYNDSLFFIAYQKNNVSILKMLLENYEKYYLNINSNFDNNTTIITTNNNTNSDSDIDNNENENDYNLEIDDRNLMYNGKTLLMLACSHGNHDMVESLLKYHVNSTFKNNDGNTALHFACLHRNLSEAELLLKNNPNLANISNNNGKTPLMIACKLGDEIMISLLLKYHTNINHKDNYDKTPLMVTGKNDHLNIVKKLINKGLNQNNEQNINKNNNDDINNNGNINDDNDDNGSGNVTNHDNKNNKYNHMEKNSSIKNNSFNRIQDYNRKLARKPKINKLKHKISNIKHHHYSQCIKTLHKLTLPIINDNYDNFIINSSTKINDNNNYNNNNNNNSINNNKRNLMDTNFIYHLNKYKNATNLKASKMIKGNSILNKSKINLKPNNKLFDIINSSLKVTKRKNPFSFISNDTNHFFIASTSKISIVSNDNYSNDNFINKNYNNTKEK